MRESIERRIQEFLAHPDPRREWMKPTVREHGFLPVYFGWTVLIGLRPDGSLVEWDHEHRRPVSPLSVPFLQRMALCQAAKKYPELTPLIPSRPAEARDCEQCHGSGDPKLEKFPGLICACGGVGWVVPGEQRDVSPG